MENIQIGPFIRDVRVEQGMTQQQLADKLGVTDKAVSKWERGVSYPDITILRELADALGVSVSELLAGKRDAQPSPVPPEVEDVVLDTVSYAETARKKNSGWKFVVFLVLSACCAIGALVCFIFFCIGSFGRNWTTAALQSIALGWAVCYPLLRVERYPVRRSMTILSAAVFPYLACLPDGYLEPKTRTLKIILLSLAYMWAVYFVCVKRWRDKLLVTGWVLFLGGFLSLGISFAVNDFAGGVNLISVAALLATGGCCLLGCFWRRLQDRAWRR